MFCVSTEVFLRKLIKFQTNKIMSHFLCLRLISPNYIFMRCHLYSDPIAFRVCTGLKST